MTFVIILFIILQVYAMFFGNLLIAEEWIEKYRHRFGRFTLVMSLLCWLFGAFLHGIAIAYLCIFQKKLSRLEKLREMLLAILVQGWLWFMMLDAFGFLK